MVTRRITHSKPQQLLAKVIVWFENVAELVDTKRFLNSVELAQKDISREPSPNTLVVAIVTDEGALLRIDHHILTTDMHINRLIHQSLRPFISKNALENV